jgi:hypothetical protein
VAQQAFKNPDNLAAKIFLNAMTGKGYFASLYPHYTALAQTT